ncbi:MAG: aspartate--tRNA ligase [Deltaproteobacteria bacterium]|nr:aspartate--tRNA ligase [Deltaproteobacteria bacterium]
MKWRQRTYCGELTRAHIGRDVLLMGWVDAIRDHGNLLFIHLRDVKGMVQVVFSPEKNRDCYETASYLREECIIEVFGQVEIREKGTENPKLETGDIEVFATNLEILAKSKPLPFQVSEKSMVFGEEIKNRPENIDEDLRLRHRYLDLRRPSMQEMFVKRDQITRCIREYLQSLSFIEVETPFLTKSTPEGARDYLVPSRVHHGKFYALPQSPQLFKQLLMMSGMDRYFQIARCFRDEDLRPNRQPEFTQMDMEASFIDEEFIYETVEELTVRIFAIGGIRLNRPFPRMTYQEAMNRYGSDRPDIRFDMSFEDVTTTLKDTNYTVFQQIIKQAGRIKGFRVRDQVKALSKNILQNEYAMKIAPSFGAKGMSWMKVIDGRLQSNIVQFFSPEEQKALMDGFRAKEGDTLIMIADPSLELVHTVLNKLRFHIAERLGLIPKNQYCPLWVTDFPLFELKEDGLSSQHHPFTMPDRIDFNPHDMEDLLNLRSRAYDLVMNGEELGGGSIRIHTMEIQNRIFQALSLTPDEIEAKFGFFLRALEYGAPPHGGLALGMDRVISMILKTSSIRDVIAFPKNRSALCPLTRAPSDTDISQLDELGISIKMGDEAINKNLENALDKEKSSSGMTRSEKISKRGVAHVAKLARLTLLDDDMDQYQKDLNTILYYVDKLDEVDTKNVSPMSHAMETENIWREDIKKSSKNPDTLLENAPEREDRYYKVPKILER